VLFFKVTLEGRDSAETGSDEYDRRREFHDVCKSVGWWFDGQEIDRNTM
jgi:hypothetical protein